MTTSGYLDGHDKFTLTGSYLGISSPQKKRQNTGICTLFFLPIISSTIKPRQTHDTNLNKHDKTDITSDCMGGRIVTHRSRDSASAQAYYDADFRLISLRMRDCDIYAYPTANQLHSHLGILFESTHWGTYAHTYRFICTQSQAHIRWKYT